MNNVIKHLFIINPKSFWKKTKQNYVVAKIHQFFREMENSEYEIYVSRFPRDAVGFIPQFAKNLPGKTILRVYAVGGDGILYDCLNGIVGLKNAELAAIPYGQTNNFVQGFDKNDRFSFRLLSQQYNAPAIPMDIMRCGTNYALNYCCIGVEAEAIHRAAKMREKLGKTNALNRWICRRFYLPFFFMCGFAACADKQLLHQRYEIAFDEERLSGNFAGISIFNGSYYGGHLHPMSNAMPNDGILDILALRIQGSIRTFISYLIYAFGGYKMFSRNLIPKRGKNITIHSDTILEISIDGIVFFESEFEVEILPGAIKFVDAGRHGYKGVRQ